VEERKQDIGVQAGKRKRKEENKDRR